MARSVNAVFGGSGIFGKPEIRSVIHAMPRTASASLSSYQPGEDYLLDLYVYVSGDVVQHGQSGVKLGNVGRKSRSLWVRIYVPDDVSSEDQATAHLSAALSEAAELVLDRLRRRAPDWPAQTLAAELTDLADALRRKSP